jgi:hypothetical protein
MYPTFPFMLASKLLQTNTESHKMVVDFGILFTIIKDVLRV